MRKATPNSESVYAFSWLDLKEGALVVESPPNTLGIARDSISGRAYSFTLAQYQWIERPGVQWLTWRPALVILAGIITYFGVAVRRRLRPLLWAGGLIGAQLLNVAAMTPAHEFRYAFGIYLLCLMSLPFWWLIARPGAASIESAGRLDSPL